ncbi:hypothetical protein JCM3770_002394 [Rhodotorula araucariae]
MRPSAAHEYARGPLHARTERRPTRTSSIPLKVSRTAPSTSATSLTTTALTLYTASSFSDSQSTAALPAQARPALLHRCPLHALPLDAAGILLLFWATIVSPRLGIVAPPVLQARICATLRFFSHSHRLRTGEMCARLVCATLLVETSSTSSMVAPVKVYGYHLLKCWLAQLLKEPWVEQMVKSWRDRLRQAGVLKDVCDGTMWPGKRDMHGMSYQDVPLSLSIPFGWDGFSPFHGKHTSHHSSGALFVSLLDLPLYLRQQL